MIVFASVAVLFPLIIAFGIAGFKVLDKAKVDTDFDLYAEKADLESFLKMPANALVNIAYSAVGFYWIYYTRKKESKLQDMALFFYVFSWMAVFYGPVQFGRIVTQTRLFAIMDQWLTLPFFAWVICWNEFVYRDLTLNPIRTLRIVFFSCMSYFVVLLHDQGFELLLGLHILAAVAFSMRTQSKYGSPASRRYFLYAIICCCGFVGLKLADHYLAQFSMFQRFTGHFWSKVCDVGQFHFAVRFFQSLNLVKHRKKN